MTEPEAPRPTFVLGYQRTGTTWLANVLAGHPEIAAVEAEDHHGVHESIFFSHFAKAYGDLADPENFETFARDFASSDYYLLTGVEEDWIRDVRPSSYAEAFRGLMDEFARRRCAARWLEKSPDHTLLARELAASFPDAAFVCVTRSVETLIRSRLWAYGRTPPGYPRRLGALVRGCAAVALHQRVLREFDAECDRSILTSYEMLTEDLEREIRRITAFLGVGFDSSMLAERYAPNTSFAAGGGRRRALGRVDLFVVRVGMLFLGLVPPGLLRVVAAVRDRGKPITWPDWCWTRRPRPSARP